MASTGRQGVTFLEILVATLIVAVALIPIFRGFSTVTTSVAVSRDRMTALFLAQAILESARFRLHHDESRFFDITTPDGEINRRIDSGRWMDFFRGLGHERRPVVSSGATAPSTYFATVLRKGGAAAGPFDPSLDPAFCRRLSRYACEVKVAFESPEGEIIDPDADGHPAHDMAWITITVYWRNEARPEAPEKSVTLTSLLTERTICRGGG